LSVLQSKSHTTQCPSQSGCHRTVPRAQSAWRRQVGQARRGRHRAAAGRRARGRRPDRPRRGAVPLLPRVPAAPAVRQPRRRRRRRPAACRRPRAAASQAAPAASQGGRSAADPGPACGGNQAGSAGVAGDGLGAAGGAARALGCSLAFAEEVNAETVAARARMGGFVACRLEAEVRAVGLAALLCPVCRAGGRMRQALLCRESRGRGGVRCSTSCALPQLAGSGATTSADAGLRRRGQVVWRGGAVIKEVDARTTHLVVLPPPDAGAPALPWRRASA